MTATPGSLTRLQAHWYARLPFILIGVWAAFFALLLQYALFHDGVSGLGEYVEEMVGGASYGALVVGLPAVLILNGSEVWRSVPFVWVWTQLSGPLAYLLEERLGSAEALFLLPPAVTIVSMIVARLRYPRPVAAEPAEVTD